jgi:hypothetical protein
MESSDEDENQKDKETKEKLFSLKTWPNDTRIFIVVETSLNGKQKTRKGHVDTGSTIKIIKGMGGNNILAH